MLHCVDWFPRRVFDGCLILQLKTVRSFITPLTATTRSGLRPIIAEDFEPLQQSTVKIFVTVYFKEYYSPVCSRRLCFISWCTITLSTFLLPCLLERPTKNSEASLFFGLISSHVAA